MIDFTCDTNYLIPTGFKVIISRREYPHLQFFAQQIQHPSLELPVVETPFKRIGGVPFPGDALQFGSLSMDVILDENMKVYEEIYDWMFRLVQQKHKPQEGRLFRTDDPASYADIRISILTSHNNANRQLKYVNALPITLGDITLASTTDGQFITFPVNFRFDYFEFA
jgi:hypothetical protein